MGGIDLHDMPEDGFFPYFNHGFGAYGGLFGEACAVAACQNHCFHVISPMMIVSSSFSTADYTAERGERGSCPARRGYADKFLLRKKLYMICASDAP